MQIKLQEKRERYSLRFISKHTVYEYLEAPPKINVAK